MAGDDELETLPRPPAFTTLLREEPLVLPRQDPPRDAGVPPVPPLPPRVMPLHELALERAELLPLHELHTRGVARRLALDRAIAPMRHGLVWEEMRRAETANGARASPAARLAQQARARQQREMQERLERPPTPPDDASADGDAAEDAPAAASKKQREKQRERLRAKQRARRAKLLEAVIAAVREGDIDEIRRLHDAEGADVNLANPSGNSPLIAATRRNRADVAVALVELGADVNLATTGGDTPLILTGMYGHVDVARALVDRGADVHQTDKNGLTPLTSAIRNGHAGVARLLLDRGADVDQAEHNGWSPLWIAAMYGRVEAARVLVDRGADVNRAAPFACAANGATPFACMAHGGPVMLTPLHAAVRSGHAEVVRLLLAGGAFLDRAARARGPSLAELCVLAPPNEAAAVRAAAEIVVESERPWSPARHRLHTPAARARAAHVVRVGHLLAARPGHGALADVWVETVMPFVRMTDLLEARAPREWPAPVRMATYPMPRGANDAVTPAMRMRAMQTAIRGVGEYSRAVDTEMSRALARGPIQRGAHRAPGTSARNRGAQRAAATGGTHTLNHWGTLIPNPTTAALETERRYARGAMFAMNPFERR